MHRIQLIIGYVLVAILLVLGTTILLYLAYGFGLNKNGDVIQNGLVFVSSTPTGANIKINGTLTGSTNARLILPSGQYLMQLNRTGYRTWKRSFNVEGGSVEHFDYPFLIPTNLVTKTTTAYTGLPALTLQSPDRRWLLVEEPTTLGTFDEYDLNNPKTSLVNLAIPKNILTPVVKGAQSLSLVQWSTDNQHVILAHNMPSGVEYIMFDRQNPATSVNLTKIFGNAATTIQFDNNVYNQFYLYNAATLTLSRSSLNDAAQIKVLSDVLAFKSYNSNIILYASSNNVPAGMTAIRLLDGTTSYDIRTVASGSAYLLNLAQYSGNWIVAVGASSENKVYVYENPEQDLQNSPNQPLVPVALLKVNLPNYLDFSADTRMLMVENGPQFAVYDALNDKQYGYTLKVPIDKPQTHATWMNGEEINVTSNNKVIMFDYDDANQQVLEPSIAQDGNYFDQGYKYIYGIIGSSVPSSTQPASAVYDLTNTALRTPKDL